MRERGFVLQAWMIQAGIVLGVMAAVFIAAGWYLGKVRAEAKDAGMKQERLVWQERESAELAQQNAKILELEAKARALEQKSVDDVAALAVKYDKDIKNANAERDRALAERRAGTAFGLRWKPEPAAGEGSGRDSGAALGAAAGQPAGAASCGLPGPTSDDLIRLATDADKVVAERNEAVAIAKKDREICGQ